MPTPTPSTIEIKILGKSPIFSVFIWLTKMLCVLTIKFYCLVISIIFVCSYQNLFNEDFSHDEAVKQIETWLHDDGLHTAEIKELREKINSDEITNKMKENRHAVEDELRVKGIPTMLYDGGRHTGLYKAE